MSYIVPNSNIRILQKCPLDMGYVNTIYFSSQSAQQNYFAGLTKYDLSQYSYQRAYKNTMKVGIQAENLYNCNYMMFQNYAFGTKWFYAFITKVEYINDKTSEITYEIDVMQTWFFNYTLKPCFVEREHTITDKPGDNIIPESLETGDYMLVDLGTAGIFKQYKIVVASTFSINDDETIEDASGGLYGGCYSGLHYNIFDTVSDVNNFLDLATKNAKSDGIVSVFMMPSEFARESESGTPYSKNITVLKNQRSIGGYTPRNKKLLTFPYNTLYVLSSEGKSGYYPFEYFSSEKCEFTLQGCMNCNPQVMMFPRAYKGVTENYNEQMMISDFPQCAYTIDTYKAWLAQQGGQAMMYATNLTTGIGGSGLGAVAGMAGTMGEGGVYGALATTGISGVMSLVGTMIQDYQHKLQPDHSRGSQGSNIKIANKTLGFHIYQAHIHPQFAKIIDSFFDRYGYASHVVKVPNRNARPYWTYTKTVGCSVFGSLPASDAVKIQNIYDNGITFWKNGQNVGNYTLDNSI